MTTAGPGSTRIRTDALHLFALWGAAVAQPIYDLLSQNDEFFVAHGLGTLGIVGFVLSLSFGVPAALVAVGLLTRRVSPGLQRVLHMAAIWGLSAGLMASVARKVPIASTTLSVVLALGAATVLALAYVYRKEVRSFASLLSIGSLVYPALFLFVSPVSHSVVPRNVVLAGSGEQKAASITKPVPIVFVIFDEFEAGALLDGTGQIDAVRFPNFAALAGRSWWFPRATTVWAETKRAVPAILTGMRPKGANELTFQSHPNNLFTWLSGTYRLNVTETVTGLCPPDACPGASTSRFRPKVFLSDLGVIYLHIVLPPAVAAKRLPSLDAGWAGFAEAAREGGDQKDAFQGNVQTTVYGDRRSQFLTFVRNVQDGTTLNFLHMLLPHNPQAYLPSGATYLGWQIDGLVNGVWDNNAPLIALGYQRYLLQLGFVDSLLGTLVDRLKQMKLYDSALIVVTADHGRSFLPGQRTRSTSPVSPEQASEMFQVPLFVKLPGQTTGQRSERFVHTVDILPTVADILGAELPWRSDGTSVFSPSFPAREILAVPPLDGVSKTLAFRLDALTTYPRLAWKLDRFGARTPVDQIAISGPYAAHLGRSTAELPIAAELANMRADVEQLHRYADVDRESGIVPALLRGQIDSLPNGRSSGHVAIGLNGKVVAIVETAAWAGKPYYFAAMLPESAFQNGRNSLELFVVETREGTVLFAPVALPDKDLLRIESRQGEEVLVSQSGQPIRVRSNDLAGKLDTVQMRPGLLTLGGWAVHAGRKTPLSRVVVFSKGRQIFEGTTGANRPELVGAFKAEGAARAGFNLKMPIPVTGQDADLRLFALSEEGTAVELAWTDEARASLKQLLR